MSRLLRHHEKILLTKILSDGSKREQELLNKLDSALVEEMSDGGMGSIRFLSGSEADRRIGATVTEAEFLDEDGVTVNAVVNLDQFGDLFELDIWKVDFTPLKRWPGPDMVTVKRSE